MPILGIETTTLVCSVALTDNDRLLAELTVQTKKTHSERLMPYIQKVLTVAGVARTEIEAIAVSIGPGSFTGIRIGLASAKALAYALKIPLLGIPTLQSLAYGCPAPGSILAPMMDAQKGNVYVAFYRWDRGELKEISSPAVRNALDVLDSLHQSDEPVIWLGEGALDYQSRIRGRSDRYLIAPPHVVMPRAATTAVLGQKRFLAGEYGDAVEVHPFYVRRPEAEELWEKRYELQK